MFSETPGECADKDTWRMRTFPSETDQLVALYLEQPAEARGPGTHNTKQATTRDGVGAPEQEKPHKHANTGKSQRLRQTFTI